VASKPGGAHDDGCDVDALGTRDSSSGGRAMRVVVTGATGNVGTSIVEALSRSGTDEVVAIARRLPQNWVLPDVSWWEVDVARDDLATAMFRADALIHLAWRFHPTRRPAETWHDNVVGIARTLAAAVDAGVGVAVIASSIGAYSPADSDAPVDEEWPTHALPPAAYGLQKSYVERMLDAFAVRHPDIRLVRIRPAFVFKRPAAPEQRRIFAGPLLPGWMLAPGRMPVVPMPRGLRLSAVHADDLAAAFVAALRRPVSGAFNVAAEPVLRAADVAELLGARPFELPPPLVRTALAAAFHLRLVPAEPGLFDLFRSLPTMDTTRARTELGWSPQRSATEAVAEFLVGLREPTGGPTPRLDLHAGGPGRVKEVLTGVGAKE
jgi:UDP-glucose 4-epimerase